MAEADHWSEEADCRRRVVRMLQVVRMLELDRRAGAGRKVVASHIEGPVHRLLADRSLEAVRMKSDRKLAVLGLLSSRQFTKLIAA